MGTPTPSPDKVGIWTLQATRDGLRIVFVGSKRTIEIPLSKVVSLDLFRDGFNVAVANGKTRVFGSRHPGASSVAHRLVAGTQALHITNPDGSALELSVPDF